MRVVDIRRDVMGDLVLLPDRSLVVPVLTDRRLAGELAYDRVEHERRVLGMRNRTRPERLAGGELGS
jgi:hypothetical protein